MWKDRYGYALVLAVVLITSLCIGRCVGATIHSKFGATATVGEKYAAQFQALVDGLEAQGARIRFMGGTRRGRCATASKHPCGMALDVCQLSRGRVDSRCHLPDRHSVSEIARKHGLFSGGDWCSSDYGHFEAGGSTACHQRGSGKYAKVHFDTSRHRHSHASLGATSSPPSSRPQVPPSSVVVRASRSDAGASAY